MQVLIAADMEGVAGIDRAGDCLPAHPAAYARGRRLMTDEVLVAVDALRAGGVERIVVGDWHMVGTNIERERMPPGVEVRPIAELALVAEDPSFATAAGGPLDAVLLLGHHASTPNPRAFCSHTFVWEMEVVLDGESLSEVRVYAQGLAAEGIPVLVASGDRWMLDELDDGELGGARLVETKVGEGRARASSHPLATTRAELADAIRAALADGLPAPPPARSYPAELEIRYEGEQLLRTTVSAPGELLGSVAAAFRAGAPSREYRQLARLFPAGDRSRIQRLHRRLGGALATPVMRSKERRWLAAARP
ncbi:MAG TPA: M55 family metallopeptidase [Conexibacter sp.]|nr:M55 family metallopeptidase [Conexibacter sp.]